MTAEGSGERPGSTATEPSPKENQEDTAVHSSQASSEFAPGELDAMYAIREDYLAGVEKAHAREEHNLVRKLVGKTHRLVRRVIGKL